MDDQALLREYAESGSEEAFRALVERHVHHVYSGALRETREPYAAEELTQVTFIILSRKARVLPKQVILSGWLFQTMRYAAKNARREEARRRRREEEAAHMTTENETESDWERIAPLLNDALGSLSEPERNVVALRFFDQKTHTELAQVLGINETSARKRLSRAIEKLRSFLARRGVVLPAAALTTLISTNVVQAAPATLAFGVSGAVQSAVAAPSAMASVKGTLQMMAWAKIQKLALVGIAALLLVGGTAAVLAPGQDKDRPRFVRLSDGSLFGIEQYVLGTKFNYKRSGGSLGVNGGGFTNLFIATSRTGGSKSSNLSIGRLQLVNDLGATFDGIFAGGTLVFNNERHNVWRVPAFPRRGKELSLRFFHSAPNGKWEQVAEFNIPNPAAAESFVEWEPEILPATKSDGDVSVTLETFEAGVSAKNLELSTWWRRLPATRAVFGLSQGGRDETAWNVHRIEVSDATGNRWKPFDLLTKMEAGLEPRLASSWLGALWPQEPAWKLRVELSRTNDFRPEEILEVPGIPVPKNNELLSFLDAYEVNGAFVTIPLIAAPEVELPDPYKWSRQEGWHNLAVSVDVGKEKKRFTLVKVVDDRGRMVELNTEGARGESDFVYGLKPKRDARHLNFTFASHQSRFVEFLAKPTQVNNN